MTFTLTLVEGALPLHMKASPKALVLVLAAAAAYSVLYAPIGGCAGLSATFRPSTAMYASSPNPPALAEAPPAPTAGQPSELQPSTASPPATLPAWLQSEHSALAFNSHAQAALASIEPRHTVLHFTFGTSSMSDFLTNWLHFVNRAALAPVLVGVADEPLGNWCQQRAVPAVQRRRSKNASESTRVGGGYIRHEAAFLELGDLKLEFLTNLLELGFTVLYSDLDVVWLAPGWERWMVAAPMRTAGRDGPLAEARLLVHADILVSTDELDAHEDALGTSIAS